MTTLLLLQIEIFLVKPLSQIFGRKRKAARNANVTISCLAKLAEKFNEYIYPN